MRWEILKVFEEQIGLTSVVFEDVALVGGHLNEPELKVLNPQKVTFFGIESDPRIKTNMFDLNFPQEINTQYNLVLCSQVLEHVYDVKQAILNLANLTSTSGYLWIACPASNYPHGSPHYFSAGYTPELISNLLEPLGFKIILAQKYGSERMYFFTHALRRWPTKQEYYFPLRLRISRYLIRDLIWRIATICKSPRFDSELHHATETVVFAQKEN